MRKRPKRKLNFREWNNEGKSRHSCGQRHTAREGERGLDKRYEQERENRDERERTLGVEEMEGSRGRRNKPSL